MMATDKQVEAAIVAERTTVEAHIPEAAHWPDDYDEAEQAFMRVKMRAALEAAEAAAWQPIETAPRGAGSEVLLNVPPFAPMQGVRRSDGSWMVGARSIIWTALRAEMEPTHWRPLPAPPEETPDAR